ncbi:hypothetical protein PsorP6_001833 [Peronosclerospora sorghi]|uniref:Uncharacterized protein n=1 Tax=Peronosclerospora sorghi TaxID=230839 RepID=A0ACC0WVF0_9STRA|nr:hypothetical protein PsorP6_001833 [Peronosclerospora sorghi]
MTSPARTVVNCINAKQVHLLAYMECNKQVAVDEHPVAKLGFTRAVALEHTLSMAKLVSRLSF